LLESESDIVVVGEASTAAQALARIPALRPDVALLDVRLPDGDGVTDPRYATLTEQERRILDLIAEGRTNRQIAESMFLAEKTVKNYVSGLLRKLGVDRRTEAAVYAVERAQRIPPQ
jgi:DNA-binding NarL/FixJ family response regulator